MVQVHTIVTLVSSPAVLIQVIYKVGKGPRVLTHLYIRCPQVLSIHKPINDPHTTHTHTHMVKQYRPQNTVKTVLCLCVCKQDQVTPPRKLCRAVRLCMVRDCGWQIFTVGLLILVFNQYRAVRCIIKHVTCHYTKGEIPVLYLVCTATV